MVGTLADLTEGVVGVVGTPAGLTEVVVGAVGTPAGLITDATTTHSNNRTTTTSHNATTTNNRTCTTQDHALQCGVLHRLIYCGRDVVSVSRPVRSRSDKFAALESADLGLGC